MLIASNRHPRKPPRTLPFNKLFVYFLLDYVLTWTIIYVSTWYYWEEVQAVFCCRYVVVIPEMIRDSHDRWFPCKWKKPWSHDIITVCIIRQHFPFSDFPTHLCLDFLIKSVFSPESTKMFGTWDLCLKTHNHVTMKATLMHEYIPFMYIHTYVCCIQKTTHCAFVVSGRFRFLDFTNKKGVSALKNLK